MIRKSVKIATYIVGFMSTVFTALVLLSPNHFVVKPRDGIEIINCDDCIKKKEIAGTLAAIAVQIAPHTIPKNVEISNKCFVMEHYNPKGRLHYVAFPRKDIKDFGEIGTDDLPYVAECFSMFQRIIQREHTTRYRILSNGPYFQDVRMLHFHLIIDEPD